MTWSNSDEETALQIITPDKDNRVSSSGNDGFKTLICPSCGQTIRLEDKSTGIQDLPGLPAGVKFDPSDQEILQHLEAKVLSDTKKIHPLIDEFIPTIEGENGICYTHPEKLPEDPEYINDCLKRPELNMQTGVSKEGQIRHFFHRPSKAYTTGTRKRRKVQSESDDGETRWHKTGKTRAISAAGAVKGYKKILVLYTNYGRQRKPEKTNWVMHQYHLGLNEEEKDGELVLSKVFYQTQPRQSRTSDQNFFIKNSEYYSPAAAALISYTHDMNRDASSQMIPDLVDRSNFIRLPSSASKGE